MALPVREDRSDIRLVKCPASNDPTLPPTYQRGGSRRIPWNALAHFRSTPKAIAKGRNFSNISGVLTTLRRSLVHSAKELLEPEHPL